MEQNSQFLKGVIVQNAGSSSSNNLSIDYFSLIYRIILKRWYFYVLSGALFLALAYFLIQTLQPQFAVDCKIVIRQEKENSSGGSSEDWLKRSLELSTVSENVYNEIQQLTSFSLMRQVVDELGLNVDLHRQYFLSKIDAYKDFPVNIDTFSLVEEPYKFLKFKIEPINYTTYNLLQDTLVGTYSFDSLITNNFGTFKLSVNNKLPIYSDTTLNVVFNNSDKVTEDLLKRLKADFTDKNSTTIGLSIIDAIPERGIDILNSLIEKYNDLKAQENNKNALNTLSFINERLSEVGTELRSVESNLERYKQSNQIVSETASDLEIVLNNVDQLSEEREDVELELSILRTMELALNSEGRDFDLIPISGTLKENVQISELIRTYNNLVLERRQLLVTGQPNNPVVQSINQKLNSLKNTIFSTFTNLENDYNLRLEMINQQYDRSIGKLKEVPTQERQLVDKSRQQGIVENLYIYLLEKKEEAAIALVSTQPNSNVIDPPHSTIKPVRPNKILIYLGALFGGVFIPFTIFSIGELFRESVDKLKEIKRILNPHRPIATIPEGKGKQSMVMNLGGRNIVADSFRYLRNNIQHYFREPRKVILVTSSISGEGKSFVASNLVTSFALSNKPSIIVYFDMYKPNVVETVGKESEVGLKNYLSSDLSIEDLIHVSPLSPNLHYIAGGKGEGNPADLIANDTKLTALFQYLRENYEIVVVDTPPVGIISDAFLLNEYVTQTIFVIRAEMTEKDMILNGRDLFDQEKFVNPRFVINGIHKNDIYDYSY